jgi:peptidoglycan L-alanyl-D-glutamate endopeptidase CwlK
MFKYSKKSLECLETCHPDIQLIFNEAIKYMDITIIEGARDRERQDMLYSKNKSRLEWPRSAHNVSEPDIYSMAVDAAPYNHKIGNIDWRTDSALYDALKYNDVITAREIIENIKRWKVFIGFILGIAAAKNISMINGSDWNYNFKFDDHLFIDSPHFQLKERKG